MKKCIKCDVEKELDEFYVNNKMLDGHYNTCKVCYKAYTRARHNALRDTTEYKESRYKYYRKAKLRDAYGISEEEYLSLLDIQDGRCAICGTTEPGGNSRVLVVDHDHATGRVRGLLCNDCNVILGFARDEPERLRLAAVYLEGVVF